MEEAVAALLTQRNHEEVARAVGIGTATLLRWTDADDVPYLLLRQELPRGYAPDRYSPECAWKSGGASATWARIPCPARFLSGNIGSFDESRVNLLIQRMSYDPSKDQSDRSDVERGRAIR